MSRGKPGPLAIVARTGRPAGALPGGLASTTSAVRQTVGTPGGRAVAWPIGKRPGPGRGRRLGSVECARLEHDLMLKSGRDGRSMAAILIELSASSDPYVRRRLGPWCEEASRLLAMDEVGGPGPFQEVDAALAFELFCWARDIQIPYRYPIQLLQAWNAKVQEMGWDEFAERVLAFYSAR